MIGNVQSPIQNVTSGVAQGASLSHFFFLIYENELHNNVTSKLKLHVDECALYNIITTEEDSINLKSVALSDFVLVEVLSFSQVHFPVELILCSFYMHMYINSSLYCTQSQVLQHQINIYTDAAVRRRCCSNAAAWFPSDFVHMWIVKLSNITSSATAELSPITVALGFLTTQPARDVITLNDSRTIILRLARPAT